MKYDEEARIKEEVDLCLEMLDSGYEEAHVSALLHLCRIGKPAVPHLVGRLSNLIDGDVSDYGPESYIVRALGIIGDPAAVDVLSRLLSKTRSELGVSFSRTETLSLVAFRALSKMGTKDALRSIVEHIDKLESEDALAMLEEFDGVMEELVSILKSGTAEQQRVAAEVLGAMKEESSVQDLLELLKSKDKEVQRKAVDALKQIGDESAIPRMLDFLKSMPREKEWYDRFTKPLRWKLVDAIGEIGGVGVVPDLLKEASSGHASGKKAAYRAIIALGEAAIETLIKAVQEGDESTQEVASKLIAEIKSKRD